jgi:hypothetical protein
MKHATCRIYDYLEVFAAKLRLDLVEQLLPSRRFVDDLQRGAPPSADDWNKIAWCLWTTEPAIARHDNALNKLLNRVVETIRNERRKPYRQLASAYLADFAVDRDKLREISRVLRGYASVAGAPWG